MNGCCMSGADGEEYPGAGVHHDPDCTRLRRENEKKRTRKRVTKQMTNEEYYKQGERQLESLMTRLEKVVAGFPEPRQALVRKLLGGQIGDQFLTAPASTRRAYHNAFPCGLLAHSLDVVGQALLLANTLAPNRWPAHKIAFVALFHDLGKAGSPGKPYYVPVDEPWKDKRGEFFRVSYEEWMPCSEKSLFLLQSAGIVLDHEETATIRLTDGMGSESNREYAFREPDLALIVHWADHWQMRMEKALNAE